MRETEEERQAFRMEIAERQNAQVRRARELLGPAKAYGKYILHDTTGREPNKEVFCCRYPDQVGWKPSAEEAFGAETLYERRTDKWVEVKGERCYFMRWQLWCGSLEEYHPLAPEDLKRRNETRKANKRAKELDRDKKNAPLFAAEIQAEG